MTTTPEKLLDRLRRQMRKLEELTPSMPTGWFPNDAAKQAYFAGWSAALRSLEGIIRQTQQRPGGAEHPKPQMPEPYDLLVQLERAKPPDSNASDEQGQYFRIGWSDALFDLDSFLHHPDSSDEDKRSAEMEGKVRRILEGLQAGQQQMKARSGPIYEGHRRVMDGWVAAGRPRRGDPGWASWCFQREVLRRTGDWQSQGPFAGMFSNLETGKGYSREEVVEAGVVAVNMAAPGWYWHPEHGFQALLLKDGNLYPMRVADDEMIPTDGWHHRLGCACKFCRQAP